jgi:hypothetical protein
MQRSALLLVPALALLLGAAACGGGGGNKSFSSRGIGVTFTYPSSFKPIDKISFQRTAGAEAAARGGVALDKDDAIIVSRYDLKVKITARNLARYKGEVDSVIGRLAGTPVSGRRVTYGGLPGYAYTISLTNPASGVSRMAVLFDQATEYLVNCQSTPAKRSAIDAACRTALDTLKPK